MNIGTSQAEDVLRESSMDWLLFSLFAKRRDILLDILARELPVDMAELNLPGTEENIFQVSYSKEYG